MTQTAGQTMFLSLKEAGKQTGVAVFRLLVERPILLLTLFLGWVNRGNLVLLLIGWLGLVLLASAGDGNFILMIQYGFASNLFYIALVLNTLLYGLTVAREYTDNPTMMIKDLSIFVVATVTLILGRLTTPNVVLPAADQSKLIEWGFSFMKWLNSLTPFQFFDFALLGLAFSLLLMVRRTVKLARRITTGNGQNGFMQPNLQNPMQ